jgi:hypothetical protein
MKKMKGSKRIKMHRWTWLLFVLPLLLPSCFEPERGCLDNEALNYALDADQPCSDCCEYPSLVLDVQHRYIKDSVEQGVLPAATVHEDDFGQPFFFKSVRFFVNNVHLFNAEGTPFEVEEELPLVVIEGNRVRLDTVEDNFALVDVSNLSDYTLGTIRGGGQFDNLRFDFGLADPASKANIDEVPVGHPLDEPELYLSEEEGYVFFKMELYRDTSQLGLDSVSVQIDRTASLPTFNFPINFFLNPGFNTEVILRINYADLLAGVNVRTDTAEEIYQKIVNNLANSFLVTDVTANNG